LSISKTVIELKEKPYSKCIKNLDSIDSYPSEKFKYIISQGLEYTQDRCISLCYQSYVMDRCGCYDGNVLVPKNDSKNFRLCTNMTLIRCDLDAFSLFFSKDGLKNEFCSDECPVECKKIIFTKTLTTNDFPTRSYADLLKKNPKVISQFPPGTNITYDLLRENFLVVRVFYDSLTFTQITESEKISPFNFLSIIGGTASLFLGISLLSIVEIIEIVIEVLILMFQRKTVGIDNNGEVEEID
jgi:hypothetical protein